MITQQWSHDDAGTIACECSSDTRRSKYERCDDVLAVAFGYLFDGKHDPFGQPRLREI
ncbi:hypothetical protein BDU57DRAFT_524993 [Ampelomyces quisqualis]|uniref:Uncharacterized protein n=1 Tax=Ampelomyces quisqualis TaxID=50730 RepID=A0A6A5Q5H0_AMPQU|nr:hypothetical protein BDU57DRAFT_524993 [Ampelomyces quisqualis]